VFGYSCEAKAEDLSLFVVQEATEMENGGQSLIVSDIQSVLNIFLSILLLCSNIASKCNGKSDCAQLDNASIL
jgi:hypothetical protein